MNSSERKLLIKQRGLVKSKLTRIITYVNNFETGSDLNLLRVRYETLSNIWEEYDLTQEKIELNDDEEDQSAERETFENNFWEVKAKITTLLEECDVKHSRESSPSQSSRRGDTFSTPASPNNVKLPTIQLPQFSGCYTEWMQFRDTFNSLIVANQTLAAIQKFYYLISSLKDEPRVLLQNMPVSSENFTIAWNLICERYDNPKLIATQHIKALLTPLNAREDSAGDLRKVINHLSSNLNAVNALNLETPLHEIMLMQLNLEQLSPSIRKEWEITSGARGFPKLEEFIKFLEERCQIIELTQRNKQGRASNDTTFKSSVSHAKGTKTRISTSFVSRSNEAMCPHCKQHHSIYKCLSFANASLQQRIDCVKRNRLCFNCLNGSHSVKDCQSGHCRRCDKKHHTLLHYEKLEQNVPVRSEQELQVTTSGNQPIRHNESEDESRAVGSYCSLRQQMKQVLLSTVMVRVQDSEGKLHPCRALLDSCSQSSFITDDMVRRLNLKKAREPIPIQGIGGLLSGTTHSVNLTVHSRVNNFKVSMNCSVLQKITDNIPSTFIDYSDWKIPSDIMLADERFNEPGKIDLLIGAELYLQLLLPDQKIRNEKYPILQETQFGYILAGNIPTQVSGPTSRRSFLTRKDDVLDSQLKRFWAIEELTKPIPTKEEALYELHYKKNVSRDTTGRFIVRLPRRQGAGDLGDSYQLASIRMQQMERRLIKNTALSQAYHTFLREYEQLGHMKRIEGNADQNQGEAFYLPHHAVIKEASTTTKTRVVFDASAKTTTGVSLNDTLLIGPTIQQDLLSIVLRFRTHAIVFTADIEKMYRQVQVHAEDTKLQRILWRDSSIDKVKVYELTTVTYGTSSAPFLATRCLHQLAEEESDNYPLAAEVLRRDFYIDDVLSGAENIKKAIHLQEELIALLRKGGFQLRKFCSNDSTVLQAIPEKDRETQLPVQLDNTDEVKTLGLWWCPNQDSFLIAFKVPPTMDTHSADILKTTITKRTVASVIASIFDPLGLVSPIVISYKMFLQQLWKHNLGWDEELTPDLLAEWQNLSAYLPEVKNIQIERHVLVKGTVVDVQLHGFADASEKAFGAFLYLRSVSHRGEVAVKLLCAKSRVAPVQFVSIPRLELCGALLLAQMVNKVVPVLNLKLSSITLWTDSTIVLSWLKSPTTRWKTFVANRVTQIQELVADSRWMKVTSEENPADLISRGSEPSTLCQLSLWWNGPSWLGQEEACWATTTSIEVPENIPEQRIVLTVLKTTSFIDEIMSRHSSLLRLQRVVAYCLRFVHNAKKAKDKRKGQLTTNELREALHTCIRAAQQSEYKDELRGLGNEKRVSPKSQLRDLHPFVDDVKLLRVGGRLHYAKVAYGMKHQLILPSKHHLTRLVVQAEHRRLLHAGPQLLIASLRQEYWIPKIRHIVRNCIHQCLICFKLKTSNPEQLMGHLPAVRVQPARPFLHTGIDYAGPIQLKTGSVRSKARVKGYGAVFVCMATKAIHLEIVSSLTAEAFIAALRRFIARRGKVQTLHSDNGTNFVGANKELETLRQLFISKEFSEKLRNVVEVERIEWHFIPPSSPHFGGLWEAGVRSMKHHLRRMVGNSNFTFEEMSTLLSQIEACLNSRPLTVMSDDPNDPSYLSPGHFLIGGPLTSFPEPNLSDLSVKNLSRWQHIQQVTHQLWKRWSSDYLTSLQQRRKWRTTQESHKPGTVVLVKEDNVPPLSWKMAVIVETFPGPDGLVRVASIKTASGLLKRPIHKLVVLPVE